MSIEGVKKWWWKKKKKLIIIEKTKKISPERNAVMFAKYTSGRDSKKKNKKKTESIEKDNIKKVTWEEKKKTLKTWYIRLYKVLSIIFALSKNFGVMKK